MDDSDFHYETTVDVRYSDLDTFGHVNNAVYVTLCEEARVDYFRDVIGQGVHDISFVIAHQELDYERRIPDVGGVTIGVDITDFGKTSFTMAYALHYDGQRVATAETVQVTVDRNGQPVDVPERWREQVAAAGSD